MLAGVQLDVGIPIIPEAKVRDGVPRVHVHLIREPGTTPRI